MRAPVSEALAARVAELRDRAEALGRRSRETAIGSTSLGIERAALRLLGVDGLDAHGRPLAATVVDRLAALGPERFGGGIALPFAVAAVEYDLGPQELALEVASGHVDLGLEAGMLEIPERRGQAERALGRWTEVAFARFDANRTARHELSDALGEPAGPWLGAWLTPPTSDEAGAEIAVLAAAGADLLLVPVPAVHEWTVSVESLSDELGPDLSPPPSGSQRGLSRLRAALDESAAERGAYARLATVTDALGAPEQAVVAGFERVDVVLADPLEEIAAGVEPERALADHAAAHALLRRSGTALVLGAGPLLVGPELARGEAADAATRAGRAIAGQAVAVALARASGLPARELIAGAPAETGEAGPGRFPVALADLHVRRLLHPDLAFAHLEPADVEPGGWCADLQAWLAVGGEPRLIQRRGRPLEFHERAEPARVVAQAAAATRAALLGPAGPRAPVRLAGPAAEMALRIADAAIATLQLVAADGWRSLIGVPATIDESGEAPRLGGTGLVARRGYGGPLDRGPLL
ncbi:MAG: hypothetical protein A2X23_00055 [Chloroflexi bacterium GWC2_73_18]|nr:MAG: hypothetical protein A2X23_00055 [Chloroflexi bacterium GWC2_73_18]